MDCRPKNSFRLRRLFAIGFVLAAPLGGGAAGAETILQSGPEQVSLIELYTSQGCSSCPPADRWLSGLKRHPDLWTKLVPLAFHVDYWDYIGWRDPLAKPEFGQRQRRYAREGGARTVYTPGVMLNGKDWRGWTRGIFSYSGRPDAGILSVERKDNHLLVHYKTTEETAGKLLAHVALLGFDLTMNVTAGENRGRKLTNDFIVLGTVQSPLRRDGAFWSALLPDIRPDREYPRLAIAAWVSGQNRQAPLQAAGSWLD